MNRLTKIGLTIFILALFCHNGFSQASVSYYNSSKSKIGLAYNFSERVWSEFRIYSETEFGDFIPELIICYNFVNKEKHNIYAGIGGVVDYFTGMVLPIGVQFTPFGKLENFSLHIEFQPTIVTNDLMLHGSWGLRYKFRK
jgi:hypothetical protein